MVGSSTCIDGGEEGWLRAAFPEFQDGTNFLIVVDRQSGEGAGYLAVSCRSAFRAEVGHRLPVDWEWRSIWAESTGGP